MESREGAGTGLEPEEVRGWAGHRLDEIGGGGVGKVEGVLVDARSERPEWLLARMGRFGHRTAVPIRDAVEGVRRVWVPYTRDLIRRAPRIEAGGSLSAKLERELLAHYGIGGGEGGRPAELAGRDPEELTARPAD